MNLKPKYHEILDWIDFILTTQVQVTKQLRRKEEEENCAYNKETYSHVKMRSFVRLVICVISSI